MERNPTPITINPILQLYSQANIGLAGNRHHLIVEILNTVMADEFVLTMKTQSAYWHANGPGLLELRDLFDQQLNQLRKVSGEISERIRVLGGFAISSSEEFLNYSRLEEQPGEVPDLMGLLSDHEALIRYLRADARICFEEYEDRDTFALFAHFIELHKKIAWVLRSYIEPELTPEEGQEENLKPMYCEAQSG